ncbi:IclR family transcriptional regulator [Streptomyces sp. NBC_01261]|uniref:IclR family transcriptional regulator n=1 Tax=unclassified Streptomyces TaxID=2593676 RepID=UPI002E323638|nr:IclR family transcriptional regulator [Streptomyces sp. NBC_01261]
MTSNSSDVEPASRDGGDAGIKIIGRAVAVLRALAGEREGLSLSQLAENTGLPRSTVHRLVSAMEVEGVLVAASTTGRVRIGPELVRVAEAGRPDVRAHLRPAMEHLAQTLGETVDLAVMEPGRLRIIDSIEGQHLLRAVSVVGTTIPLHCTANGKALLAKLSDAEVARVLPARLTRFTPATITHRAAFLDELAKVRRTGIAFDREESTPGISASAIAVQDPYGTLAALGVPMPTIRFQDRERDITTALNTAREQAVSLSSVDMLSETDSGSAQSPP